MNLEPITADEYGNAIVRLLEVASHNSSSARAAATLLLSAYNGSNWQLDVTDLCAFDHENYIAALTVLRGRKELMCEPHRLIEDGDHHFAMIWEQWKRFHISNRHRKTCMNCHGSGEVREDEYDEESNFVTCSRCNGEGLLG